MLGLISHTPCRLLTYRDGRRLSDAYQLLITKKPVEYDYVAVDLSSFIGSAARLTKHVTEDPRRGALIGRHIVNALTQLLRRVQCRRAMLLALDGAGSLAQAHRLRYNARGRRFETHMHRMPGGSLMRAVEDRVLKSMPLGRALTSAEVVVSGLGVEGAVERKVSAWALDLACRDGAQHTTNSLCIIGSGELWMNVLGLAPYFQVSNILHGGSDLRHFTLGDALAYLEAGDDLQAGRTRALSAVRADALLVYLLCNGSTVTGLSPLGGAYLPTLLSSYMAAAQAAGDADGAAHRLLREKPKGVLELDLQALRALLAGGHETPSGGGSPRATSGAGAKKAGDASTAAEASEPPTGAADTSVGSRASESLFRSYLRHALTSHYLFSHGETLDAGEVPAYMDAEASVNTKGDLDDSSKRILVVNTGDLCRYLARQVHRGRLYIAVGGTPSEAATLSDKDEGAAASRVPASYFPFWTAGQPLTAAEYAILSCFRPSSASVFLADYVPGVQTVLRNEVPHELTSPTAKLSDVRTALQNFLTYATADRPHPALCFAPSYAWLQHERSKMWAMRYVDLGVTARRQDVCYQRSQLSTLHMVQQEMRDAVVAFDAATETWVALQRDFPSLTASAQQHAQQPREDAAATGAAAETAEPTAAAAAAAASPTLKVLTWNVMFDRYSNQPTPLGMPGIDWCSPQRYPVLARLIEAEDADVVGLQEVEEPFAAYLAAQPWCRERYIMSCSPDSSVLAPWGVLLLVRRGGRWPLRELRHVNVPAWPGHVSLMPVATLDLMASVPDGGEAGGQSGGGERASAKSRSRGAAPPKWEVNVCSMHLLAPFAKAQEVARTGQDQALRHILMRQLHGDTVVMGDFNDWPSNEFVMPSESRFVDCWPLVNPNTYGKTMDETNQFCKLKIEEFYFGRADKVFVRTSDVAAAGTASRTAHALQPVEAHLVGMRSVNDENGNTDAPGYLFPSDHYGVCVTFKVLQG